MCGIAGRLQHEPGRAVDPGVVRRTLASDLRLMARLALMVSRGGRDAPARAGYRSQHA